MKEMFKDCTGRIFCNRYKIIRRLGSGANGTVYLANDLNLDKLRAVKFTEHISDEEINVLKRIEHPAFPGITDLICLKGLTGIVMEYISGPTLDKYCASHRISSDVIYAWMIQIAEALKYIHDISPTILYMDCKPSNIILGEDDRLHLVDLGSAYICGMSDNKRLSGTIPYAPPEQRDCKNVDIRSDIYALGLTVSRLSGITGKRPGINELIKHRLNGNDKHVTLSYIISRCIESDPRMRYQSVEELLYHLRHPKAITYRLPSIKEVISRAFNLVYKGIVTLFTVLSLKMYEESADLSYALLSVTLFVLLLCLSAARAGKSGSTTHTWHMEKDVFMSELSGTLLLILLCVALIKDHSLAATDLSASDHTEDIPSVTVYNSKGAKVLYKGQYIARDGDSLYLYIPAESISNDSIPVRVTVEQKIP